MFPRNVFIERKETERDKEERDRERGRQGDRRREGLPCYYIITVGIMHFLSQPLVCVVDYFALFGVQSVSVEGHTMQN